MYQFFLLGCIPFLSQLAMYMAYFSLAVKDGKNDLKYLFNHIKEDNADELIASAFAGNLSSSLFQLIRLVVAGSIALIMKIRGICQWYIAVVIGFVIYKAFYYYLLQLQNASINRINNIMPYYIKTLVSLAYCNPINVALVKSVDYCDDALSDDITLLINEIDKDPNSYKPYQNMIDRYQGRINHLDQYFQLIYRMSLSGNENTEGLLDNLNKSISEDILLTRQRKNGIVNNTTGYLGMMPVVLLVAVLSYILILVIGFI